MYDNRQLLRNSHNKQKFSLFLSEIPLNFLSARDERAAKWLFGRGKIWKLVLMDVKNQLNVFKHAIVNHKNVVYYSEEK